VDGVSTAFYLSPTPTRDDYAIIVDAVPGDTIQLAGSPDIYSLQQGTLFTPNDGLIFALTEPPQLVGVVVNAFATGGPGFSFV
jgi:hypothetical protein